MNVRSKREGVQEVFAGDRVSSIMQQALAKRYGPLTADGAAVVKGGTVSTKAERNDRVGRLASSSSLEHRLRTPQHYTLRCHSRTAYFRRLAYRSHRCTCEEHCCGSSDSKPFPSDFSTPSITEEEKLSSDGWWCEEEDCTARAVVAECLRHRSFHLLTQVDVRRVCNLPDASPNSRTANNFQAPLATWQEFFELPPRWVMQSLGAVDRHTFITDELWWVRRSVTPLDVGATVIKRDDLKFAAACSTRKANTKISSSLAEANVATPAATASFTAASHYRVVATASMSRGAFWVDIAPVADSPSDVPQTVERVDRDVLWLDPPAFLDVDPLLPCDELYSDRGVSTSNYVFFLRALQQQQQQQKQQHHRALRGGKRAREDNVSGGASSSSSSSGSASDPATVAADLALRLSVCAKQRRTALAASLRHWSPHSLCHDMAGLKGNADAHTAPSDATKSSVTAAATSTIGATTVSDVVLQVRVDTERDCLQLRAHWAHRSAEESEHGCDPPKDNAGHLREKTVSPVVEVLLRSARKLAALYDETRTAVLTRQPQSAPPSQSTSTDPSPSHPASLVLTHLCQRAEASEKEPGGFPSSLSTTADAPWHSFALHPSGSHPCSTEQPADLDELTMAEKAFLARLFTLLLRYRSLFGEQGYNQGPQAAVPPPIMEELAQAFDIRAEAFASPLNVQLPQFGSLFPDTDAYFGSMGSFFDLNFGRGDDDSALGAPGPAPAAADASGAASELSALSPSRLTSPERASSAQMRSPSYYPLDERGCHVEVNPPFDTALLRHMEEHLLACLKRSEKSTQSLLFLIVLPSHDLDAEEMRPDLKAQPREQTGGKVLQGHQSNRGAQRATSATSTTTTTTAPMPASARAVSTERALRESIFCLGHVLCAAADSVYVDGHQHLLASPFFCIGTPTRLILLGNAVARARYPAAMSHLNEVRLSWKRLTESALRRD